MTVCAAVILYEPATAAVGNSLGLEGFWVRHAAGTGALVLAGSAFLSLYIAFCNAVEAPR
ncbi:hypothetical protein [Rhodocista pekingensis]|uniref:Uncharacterized protein n=1 Tax=Rhodocista pekingensis TaxID=201185 RepID=A0ABW2KX46_9PROT